METRFTAIELAAMRDAGDIARMSRDEIEHGLQWRWRPEAIRAMIRDTESSVIISRLQTPLPEAAAGTLMGFAAMRFGFETAHLNLLAVDPRCRRQGLGRELLNWLVLTAHTAGLDRIDLEVRARNRGAQRFYRAAGFAPGKTIPGYYQGQETAVRMHKWLDSAARP